MLQIALLQRFRTLARELHMAIALTYLQRWAPAPRNTVSVIDRDRFEHGRGRRA